MQLKHRLKKSLFSFEHFNLFNPMQGIKDVTFRRNRYKELKSSNWNDPYMYYDGNLHQYNTYSLGL